MSRNYYINASGRLSRHQNTIYLETEKDGETLKKPIPVEDIESFYLFGEVDMNTKLLNFLSQKHVPIHLFNYYGYYAGSFYPREYLISGFLLVKQVEHYQNNNKRMAIAREFIKAAAHNILRNLTYYENRKENDESVLQTSISNIQQEMTLIDEAKTTNELMGVEGRIQQGESQTAEFKSSLKLMNEIGETISALANTSGGVILIGVSDEGKILGVDIGKKTMEDFAFIKENTDPRMP